MKKFNFYFLPALLIAALIVAGCFHYPENQRLDSPACTETYNFSKIGSPDESDETFIVLTFSGGGTRAAALAYGVLAKLREMPSGKPGQTLLSEVDVISTVSGGSFTGAYYALFGNRIFTDFKDKFLYRNIQGEITVKLFNPYNWLRLASPYFSRIDLAAELYDESIFERKTFGKLSHDAKKPFLIINATNLYQGARFEFTGRQFCYLGSDIRSYPVARAVAASSAFPFLLSPLSLVNYPLASGKKITPEDETAREDYWVNKRRFYFSADKTVYADEKEHPYLHLMDGGLADNLGLRAIYDLYVREGIGVRINNGRIKKMLVIVVNARAEKKENFDKKEAPPGLAAAAYKTATVSMDNYTFESVQVFNDLLSERIRAQRDIEACRQMLGRNNGVAGKIPALAGGNLKLYVADLAFDNLDDPGRRNYFNDLPTSFSLTKEQVDNLIDIGGKLLLGHPEFQRFLAENTD